MTITLVDKLQKGMLKKPIIIFIDEIDRLSEKEIAMLFKVIRNVADFPEVIYVLAYDRTVVESALEHIQHGRGEDYIQKIVQVVYPLPEANEDKIYNFFTVGLDKIFAKIPKEMQNVESIREIFNSGVSRYIKNLRECKRVLNSLTLKMASVSELCDLGDMLGLTILEHYEGKLVDFIKENKNAMCGKNPSFAIMEIKKDEAEKVYKKLSGVINEKSKNDALQIMAVLFPKFMSVAQNDIRTYNYSTRNRTRTNNVGNFSSFDNYFQLSLQNGDITDGDVIQVSSIMNKDELITIFKKLDAEKKTKRFLEKMRFLVLDKQTKFTSDSKKAFLEAVSQVQFHDYTSKFELGFGIPVTSYLDWCIDSIISENLDDEEVENYFKNKNISLTTLLEVLKVCGQGYKWVGYNKDAEQSKAVVEENTFRNIEILFWERFDEAVKNLIIANEREVAWLINLWQRHNKNECDAFLISIRNVPDCIAKISSRYIVYGEGTEGKFVDINAKEWPLYGVITMEEAYNSAKTIIDSAEFNSWDIDVQRRIMALKVLYERNKKNPAVVAMKTEELEQLVREKIKKNNHGSVYE